MKRVCGIILVIAILLTAFPSLAEPGSANTHVIPGATGNVGISWNSVAWQGNGQNVNYARLIYNKIWGYQFSSAFATSDNMLRSLSDDARRITADNTRKFISQAPLGAVIRISNARRDTDPTAFGDDAVVTSRNLPVILSNGKSKEGHTLIVVQKNDSGFTYIENNNDPLRRNETYVTWDGFANDKASRYEYFKYIKYPNATPFDAYTNLSTIELRGVVYPSVFRINTRNGWSLSGGIVVSNVELKSIDAKIVDSANRVISGMQSPKPISGRVFAIKDLDGKKVDYGQKFSKITRAGSYKWIITATDTSNRSVTLEMPINAVASGSTATMTASNSGSAGTTPVPSNVYTLEFRDVTHPVNFNIGAGSYALSGGLLVSTEELRTITTTIKKTDGMVVSGPKTRNINGKAYEIKNLDTAEAEDNGVKFSRIVLAGDYVWTLTATDAANRTVTLDMPFTASYSATTSQTKSIAYNNGVIPVSQITLNYKALSAASLDFYGEYASLEARVYPDGATNKAVTWTSSNEAVATVDKDGHVFLKGNGKATVTATAADGSGQSDTCEVEVSIEPQTVTLNQSSITLDINKTEILAAAVQPENAMNKTVVWSSDNPAVATVTDGVVTAKAAGFATITAKTAINGWYGQPEAICTVFVVDGYGVAIDANNFPDVNFREYVKQFDTNRNGKFEQVELSVVTEIDVNGRSITTLKGIEYFSKLQRLKCFSNNLTALDVSKNTDLQFLWCFNNKLTTLNTGNNVNLTELSFGGNQLTSVDLSKNTQLIVLDCESNKLASLNLSANKALQQLWCQGNPMASINISSCPHLVKLVESKNPEEPAQGVYSWSKDKDNNQYGYVLYINKTTSVNKNTGVAINETNFPDAMFRECVKAYDTDKNGSFSEAELKKINVIKVPFKQISNLKGIEFFEYLKILDCSYNQLTALDLSRNRLLAELCCSNNRISALNLSGNPGLVSLDCGANQMQTLDISRNAELMNLYCESNQFTQLDITHNTKLTRVVTRYNNLTSLDISRCPELDQLVTTSNREVRSQDSTFGWNKEPVNEQHETAVYQYKYILVIDQKTNLVTVNKDEKISAFVTRCYDIILNREPDAGGLQTWINELNSGRKAASEIIDRFVNSAEFQDKHYSKGDAVEILYKAMLGRGSDPSGKANWVSKLENGQPFAAVINGFCNSPEFRGICDSYGIKPGSVTIPGEPTTADEKIKAFVQRCYRIILNREPDEGGMNTWFNELKSRRKAASEIIDRFVNSPEFQGKNYSKADAVEILYNTMLGRSSDAAGKANWVGKLMNGQPFAVVINGFCVSPEFKGICNAYGIIPGTVKVQYLSGQSEEELSKLALNAKEPITKKSESNPTRVEIINPSDTIDLNIGTAVQAVYVNEAKAKEFISRCYQSILGREASAAELDNWIGQMTNGTKTPDQIARGFLFSNEFKGKNVGNEDLVKILYKVYMNRDADPEGLKTWTEKLEGGTELKALLDAFAKTSEFKKILSEMAQ